jgi:hypothetical protein
MRVVDEMYVLASIEVIVKQDVFLPYHASCFTQTLSTYVAGKKVGLLHDEFVTSALERSAH